MKKITKVAELELSPELTLLHVDSLDQLTTLCGRRDEMLEKNDSFFLLKDTVAFRFVKREAKPKIFKTRELWLNPDSASVKVVIDEYELLAFAVKENVPVFETQTEYIIPSAICLIAKKTKEKP
jgi:hypothetical protein